MTAPRRALSVLVGMLCILPLALLLLLSFVEQWPAGAAWPTATTARWWREIGGRGLTSSLGVSLAVSTAAATLSTFGGFLAARFVQYARRRRLWLFIAYAPFVLSPVILGVCLMYLFLRLGLAATLVGVVLAQSLFTLGFATVFFTAFWSERVRQYEGLARTLGAGGWQRFRGVVLPLARGLLGLCFFQTFLLSWFQYGITLLVGQGKVQTLPLRVFNHLNEASPYVAAVAACLLVLPPVVLLLINRRILLAMGPSTGDSA